MIFKGQISQYEKTFGPGPCKWMEQSGKKQVQGEKKLSKYLLTAKNAPVWPYVSNNKDPLRTERAAEHNPENQSFIGRQSWEQKKIQPITLNWSEYMTSYTFQYINDSSLRGFQHFCSRCTCPVADPTSSSFLSRLKVRQAAACLQALWHSAGTKQTRSPLCPPGVHTDCVHTVLLQDVGYCIWCHWCSPE